MANYQRGDVVVVNLEPTLGTEQGLVRPCVVLSDLKEIRASKSKALYVIVPLTRSETLTGALAPRLKAAENGLPSDSVALLMHVRSVDPQRIRNKVTQLSNESLEQIQQGLAQLFDI